ncbi:MAG: AraC family transcriptional regulator [Clostridia bacterium]|nr:AraC family transcriptional regulator [Clostridia bacterium]
MYHSVIISDEGYSDLNPVQFGYQDCESGHFYGPAIRTHWLIHFVVSGHGFFRRDGKEYKVGPGEMFIIPPFVETYYEADKDNPWNYIWVGFTTNLPSFPPLPPTLKLPEAVKIFNEMKFCKDFSEGRSAYLSSKLWDLFAHISNNEKSHKDYVKTALDCIHNEYATQITIEEIARKLNIDRTYFSVLFKKTIGVSPQQYLLGHRMNMAASLLRDQNISVSTAGYSVGYTDIYTFSKMFKKHFGISPTQYAKQNN